MGGTEARHNQPWMVLFGNCCQCGGTLISDRHVLTAAHCSDFVKQNFVILGEHTWWKTDRGQMKVAIQSRVKHPQYWLEGDTAAYDFAILTLETSVKFSSTILPVCLINNPNEYFSGQRVLAAGWGLSLLKEGESKPTHHDPIVLRAVNLTVHPMSKCKKAKWLAERLDKIETPGRSINETFMICAGPDDDKPEKEWIGVAQGDSGGITLFSSQLYLKLRTDKHTQQDLACRHVFF